MNINNTICDFKLSNFAYQMCVTPFINTTKQLDKFYSKHYTHFSS